MPEPRVILYDLETSQNLVAVFRLDGNDWIQPENIIQERFIISFAWKVLGESRVHATSVLDDVKRFEKNHVDDSHVCQELHDVLSSADLIVAHNGDKFDLPFAAARMAINGLPPLPPIPSIDTLKTAKRRFMFNSNKLDYLGNVLGVGRKIETSPGLWLRVLRGEKAAIREMVTYNKQDVLLLERVFLKLRPYMDNYVNRELFGKSGCPRCGSLKTQSRGTHRAISRVYQRYQCQSCGGWFKQLKADVEPRASTRLL